MLMLPVTCPAFTVAPIPDNLAQRIKTCTWRPGCPVPIEDLVLLTVPYLDMQGVERQGDLVVHKSAAQELGAIFADLLAMGFPIERMEPIENEPYCGDDPASMRANNTSAFNCRTVPGTSVVSRHSYGLAVDVNPLWNPYIRGNEVMPPEGGPWVDREQDHPGMLHAGSDAVRAFTSRGWEWGGDWKKSKDYQHFSK